MLELLMDEIHEERNDFKRKLLYVSLYGKIEHHRETTTGKINCGEHVWCV